jgi:hypothetical protein
MKKTKRKFPPMLSPALLPDDSHHDHIVYAKVGMISTRGIRLILDYYYCLGRICESQLHVACMCIIADTNAMDSRHLSHWKIVKHFGTSMHVLFWYSESDQRDGIA